MVKRTLAAAGCLVGTLVFATISSADEFHYNNILIGDRASGMGGAYTAISDDASGMYYNPAGIAYTTGKNLSASVNAYNVVDRTYKGVIGGSDWTRRSSYLLPNFFGIVQPVGKVKLGFSYAVPDSNQEDQDQSFQVNLANPFGPSTEIINFNNKNDTTLFGPSGALQLADNFSVGATLYAHKRSTEAILNASAQSNATPAQFQWSNQHVESDEWGLRPVLGLIWTPVERVSLGLAVSKTFVLTSDNLPQATVAQTGGTFNVGNPALTSFEDKREYPYQISLGVAYFPSSSLVISGDVSCFTGYDYTTRAFTTAGTVLSNTLTRDAVVNGAIGVEYYLNTQWAVRGGAFTDFANTPEVVSSGAAFDRGQQEHIDLFGGSLSLSHFTRNTSISGGGTFKYGTGKAQILGGGQPVQDADANSWTVFLSSSYSY